MIRPRRTQSLDPDNTDRVPITRERLVGYRRLLRYIRPYRARVLVALTALSLGTVLGLTMPLIIRNVVDVVFVEQSLSLLNLYTLLLALIF
ncbi:MAG: hypothetical protein KDJ97_13985, partial [Anaerolineae bacterium]|nr:hypothetical protein [Anaerolineae bacterium]